VLQGLENRFVFAPSPATENWEPPPADLNIQDVEMTSTDGTPIHAWWMTPPAWDPGQGALLYCHGNGGNLSNRSEKLRTWRDLVHQAVLIFDYPGYGRSGGKPTEAGCYAAATTAYDWLTEAQRIAGSSILLHGVSLGCAIALELAARLPHRALVLVSPFSSLADMGTYLFPWLPARWLVGQRYHNVSKIVRCRRPVFITHGTADTIIPYEQGERLFAAANEPKQFYPLPGYDHNHRPPPEFYRAVRTFLAQNEMTATPSSASS
jgi:fermentation-respiration switch protein FrsA (DUF1100 family)